MGEEEEGETATAKRPIKGIQACSVPKDQEGAREKRAFIVLMEKLCILYLQSCPRRKNSSVDCEKKKKECKERIPLEVVSTS